MGVKSLWDLLSPVGRPVMLETMEGKTMAIDSSIWIYQFQATMRAKDGQVLVNAHVLGFLRRICKLMFYGMKPVFVFDGGAPALKRNTLNERRHKKTGAAASHAKLAEKLLAAQMRREAVNHVQSKSKPGKGKGREEPVVLDENTVYLEDIDPTMPKSSAQPPSAQNSPSKSPSKSHKYKDHDPYRLPDIDLQLRLSDATRSSAPDPRLATEDELRAFIEDMRPEDFDITSAAFLELPTEVQYEIIGDLRLKSRQTSYTRLQQMLNAGPTPLDFSKQQIKNLRQRNTLTQQLLATTDSIGKAHIEIPVRIASERNRQYVLIKNEGEGKGWILGIREEGTTQDKPIVLDHEEELREQREVMERDEDDDDDMEEVAIPGQSFDPDLRDFQRHNALAAIGNRTSGLKLAPHTSEPSLPLFTDLSDDEEQEFDDDEGMSIAIQRSLEERPSEFPAYDPLDFEEFDDNRFASTSKSQPVPVRTNTPDRFSPTPLGSRLALANTTPSKRHRRTEESMFGAPSLLMGNTSTSKSSEGTFGIPALLAGPEGSSTSSRPAPSPSVSIPSSRSSSPRLTAGLAPNPSRPTAILPTAPESPQRSPSPAVESSHSPLAEEAPVTGNIHHFTPSLSSLPRRTPTAIHISDTPPPIPQTPSTRSPSPLDGVQQIPYDAAASHIHDMPMSPPPSRPASLPSDAQAASGAAFGPLFMEDDEDEEMDMVEVPVQAASLQPRPMSPLDDGVEDPPESPKPDDWDAAQEMDPVEEEHEFAKFLSDVKGKNIEDVRREIDNEISFLDKQRKAAMRDSEDVTQQMVNQIMTMLRLFGIPYITAPMEAEAQCAELLMLGLVDGIITDDSDVFLFGGERVFKNMFNQSKTVECFLSTDLNRELGLDRGTLIRLAYLLGSDYVEGLPGVGPVVAMELLREFPGDDGLHKFKEWWSAVQTGRDVESGKSSDFKRRFKKRFKDLYLGADWPNSAVMDAYYHPTVDDSDEPFKWGLPDLESLRGFLYEELGWGEQKVDDLLIPVIQKARKRAQAPNSTRQGDLNIFFDVSGGSGTIAPRQRQAYASKRLQNIVTEYRKKRKAALGEEVEEDVVEEEETSEVQPPKKKSRAGKGKAEVSRASRAKPSTRGRGSARGRGRGRGRGGRSRRQSHEDGEASNSESDGGDEKYAERPVEVEVPLAVQLRPRPKPKPAYKNAPGHES